MSAGRLPTEGHKSRSFGRVARISTSFWTSLCPDSRQGRLRRRGRRGRRFVRRARLRCTGRPGRERLRQWLRHSTHAGLRCRAQPDRLDQHRHRVPAIWPRGRGGRDQPGWRHSLPDGDLAAVLSRHPTREAALEPEADGEIGRGPLRASDVDRVSSGLPRPSPTEFASASRPTGMREEREYRCAGTRLATRPGALSAT